ncbi:helix-turn-helix domain-containing protein [Enterococcus sp. AZ196]|uniref:helix-turn-helix domain-containing protein n=1 Tax=Enterococcus sp. AZ196 TaxID=2774659 RepID=UPI003D29B295
MQLLILTKVPSYEEAFETQLKQLGNEVYCSNNLIAALKKEGFNKQFLLQFDGIIFSESLYDKEVEELIQKMQYGRFKFFRRVVEIRRDEAMESNFDGLIPVNSNLERLRELLLIAEISRLAFQKEEYAQKMSVKQKLSDLNLKLKQKEIVDYLIQSGNRTVSREEISRQIWNKEPNKSVLASLSKVVSKVNEKLEYECGHGAIQTVWGQGYRLKKEFFDYFENDLPEKQAAEVEN